MHATFGSSSSLPLAQMVAVKKDAASQTECYGQEPTANGRAVNFAQPSQSVCPDIGTENNITTEKSLSDYGVQFVSKTLQGSNMLIHSVAGFAAHHVPVIGQGLMFLATMPAQAGAYPVSNSPAYGNGSNETGFLYTPSSAYPTTNLTTTSDPDTVHLALGLMFGSIPIGMVMMCVYGYCSGAYSSYKQLKRDNPEALNRHALQAALKDPWYGHGAVYRQHCDRLQLPIPAPRTPAPTAPTTREQGTQTACERGTQTEPVIDESAPQGQQPPTYAEAITFSVR
ncbi:hypothetical protein ACTL6P_19020 [Endozoicomonas acroporae]|uniref:hypothetical protein n=1 Tax=Endozoicomonas acroporae TaxID=1701104 RepID=UPI0011AF982D|nr:hypothetical protein [Endozoicomonas acroporae]